MKNQLRRYDRSGSFFPTFFSNYISDEVLNGFGNTYLPATNVSENEKAFNIELSVPGFDKEDIKIEIEKDVLKISAQNEVKSEEKDENEKVLRREFKKSSFARSFTIPEDVDTDNISAIQKDGILQITLPKQDKAIEDKVKKIEIQ
ncbi:MAG: Hsp20 family protein [Prevotella sp.]|jgi:HSP20 family protein|uniref:Hsp20/alpha crystallin family protein n=1 Tax=unclassified Dysgonomonas TaxID=2630389 RepID=UPI0025BC13B7|nr:MULTISPECIES: Hsp20 family protein [unclassified Dysgonomonas]MDR1715453.1 Hsp20 family protein [Prevotella sp.]MDR2002748.1 Hsp20 family protein [Prevotella sp.]HMM03640.1 Hsp20 family protein [Dysgonomonas sp.]